MLFSISLSPKKSLETGGIEVHVVVAVGTEVSEVDVVDDDAVVVVS